MRIGIVTHKFVRHDGQGRVNFELARVALEAGCELTLIGAEVDSMLLAHPRVRWVEIPEGRLPSRLLRYQSVAWRAGRWLARHRGELDIVHVNGFSAWTRADVNAVHFVHRGFSRCGFYPYRLFRSARDTYQVVFTALNDALEGWAFRRSRVVVPVSHKVAAEVALHGIAPTAMEVIHNGVDTDEFRPGESERASFGLPGGDGNDADRGRSDGGVVAAASGGSYRGVGEANGEESKPGVVQASGKQAEGEATSANVSDRPFMLLFAGDIQIPRKNLDTVLCALEHTPKHVHLAIAADVSNGNPYASRVAAAGLADRVHFLGLVKRMPALMRSVDAFVFPSRYEPLGLVLLEAMSSGLPVITVKSAGGAELIDAASGIILDDPNDVDSLAAAITSLIADPARTREMGLAARHNALPLGWRSMGERYLALYRRLVASPAYETSPGSSDAAQRNTGSIS